MNEKNNAELSNLKPGWSRLPDEKIPAPTFWPAGVALGVVLFLWGLVTSVILVCVGLLLLTLSIAGWLEEMRND
jgi:hypothetical protein